MIQFVLIAAGDWWSWLVPLAFIVIYLINHALAGGGKQAGKPQQPRRRAVPGERPLQPGGQGQAKGGQTQLNAEIEQFLRRANERRLEKARREAPAARPAQSQPKPQLTPPPPPLREEPLEVMPLGQQDFDAVDESVARHMGRGLASQVEHLAAEVEHADEEMEQHLKQVFDHRLGSLGREAPEHAGAPRDLKSPVGRADPQARAKALAGLLANRQGIRQAIVLREILERPVDRW